MIQPLHKQIQQEAGWSQRENPEEFSEEGTKEKSDEI